MNLAKFLLRSFLVFFVLMAGGLPVLSASGSSNSVVVTFGDSTTAPREGVTVYTALLAEAFPHVKFLNKGVGGNTTTMAAERFSADVLAHHPKVVVIQFGINDSAVDVWKKSPATESRVSLDDYEKNLRSFVTQLQANGSKVIFMTPNQTRWSPKLRKLYGHAPYDPNSPQGFTKVLQTYAERMRSVARDLNVPLVDVYAEYDAAELKDSPCEDLLLDGMHPSSKGHALVAEKLKPALESALK